MRSRNSTTRTKRSDGASGACCPSACTRRGTTWPGGARTTATKTPWPGWRRGSPSTVPSMGSGRPF
eukprot:1923395-Lingulodinium_polyedra.AAC.1